MGNLFFNPGQMFDSMLSAASISQTNETNRAIAEANNQANRELAQYAYAQELEQWNRENAYNHPTQQMQRLSEAGLNPNLVYGSGATTLSAKSPSYKSIPNQSYTLEAPFKNSHFGAAIYEGMQLENMSAQNKVLQGQEDYIKAQTFSETATALNKLVENKILSIEAADKYLTYLFNHDTFDARRNRVYSESNLKGLEEQFQSATFQKRISQISANLKKTNAEVATSMAMAAFLYARKNEIETIDAFNEKSFQARLAVALWEGAKAGKLHKDHLSKYVSNIMKLDESEIRQRFARARALNAEEFGRYWDSFSVFFDLFK